MDRFELRDDLGLFLIELGLSLKSCLVLSLDLLDLLIGCDSVAFCSLFVFFFTEFLWVY